MPQLTYSIHGDHLVADVLINLDAPTLIALRSAGQRGQPVTGKGLVDTGSNTSGVSLAVLQGLGITPVSTSSTQGVLHSHAVQLYRVSLHLFDPTRSTQPWFTHPNLLVMDLPPSFPFDALIGMDILLACHLHLDGPGRQFILDF